MFLLLATATCSCSFNILGEPISKQKLELMSPGTTTKTELMENFGPPLAIAKPDETLLIPAPPVAYGMDNMPRLVYGPYYKAQSAPFFELFSGKHEFNKFHRVYYYQQYKYSRSIFFWLLGVHVSEKTSSDNLWVLVNEKDNKVEDYFFKSKGK